MKSSTKYLKIIINYLLMAVLVFMCFYVLPKFIGFFAPFVVAWIIALIANPLVRFLENRLKIKRKAGSAVVIVLTLVLVCTACYWIVWVIVAQASELMSNIPSLWASVSNAFRSWNAQMSHYFSKMPVSIRNQFGNIGTTVATALSEAVSSIGENAAQSAGNGFKSLPLTLVGIVMGVLASFSFVSEREYIGELFEKIVPESTKSRFELVVGTMKNAVGGYFKAQFKIMAVVYIVLFIGFLVLRIDYAILVALLIALLDFLPFFGTGTAMWPWAFIAFIQKDYRLGIGMLVVWGLSQLVRQVIQPKVLGDSVGMPAIPTLFLLYIGFRIGGAIGLIIAVPIGMIVYNLYKAGVFSNFFYSTRMLINDIKRIRVFTPEELEAEGIRPTQTGTPEGSDDVEAK